ncbi:hypothetical protein WG70_26480 [Burkholderia oklahomensis EO147]|uniref:DUF2946 domain-containing protein n=2 Tax=Burkholderia oklahomensis TaxID=342113 RepID=UPI00016A2647|nr:DUF2946 domain-containing protein [Burkholderia oklahomensis]AOI43071.1 hypothetical protein WG70_26480 [Burkholderia oklahomensis EO147]KUY57909.1 hypothetical protein WG70_08895 [Burkholderia oklahomensis EO147]QPS37809.1 DUF2946 domain-containing protein [Burkholderia oklahomensis]
MRSLLHRKIGSMLGLLAILMATLAPTVSHTLSNSHHFSELPSAFCSAQDGTDATSSDSSPSSEKAVHWQACAYCGLLAHTPAVPSTTAAFTPTIWTVRATAAAPISPPRRVFPLTAAQPRAPPVLS